MRQIKGQLREVCFSAPPSAPGNNLLFLEIDKKAILDTLRFYVDNVRVLGFRNIALRGSWYNVLKFLAVKISNDCSFALTGPVYSNDTVQRVGLSTNVYARFRISHSDVDYSAITIKPTPYSAILRRKFDCVVGSGDCKRGIGLLQRSIVGE